MLAVVPNLERTTGVLATIQLQGIGLGTSPIQLSNIILLDLNLENVAFTSVDGWVRAVEKPRFASVLPIGLIGLLSLTRSRLRASRWSRSSTVH